MKNAKDLREVFLTSQEVLVKYYLVPWTMKTLPTSHKVEEVDKLISEQEWKLKQSNFDYHLSFLSYVGMVTSSLAMIVFCYCCCCKCCKRSFPNFCKWWKDNSPCTTIVIKPKIINSIHSSQESLRFPNTRTGNVRKLSLEEAVEETELVSLRTGGKQLIHSGKR